MVIEHRLCRLWAMEMTLLGKLGYCRQGGRPHSPNLRRVRCLRMWCFFLGHFRRARLEQELHPVT